MWNFATDSRGKDKAKASCPLELNLEDERTTTTGMSTTTMMAVPVNDNSYVSSGADSWSSLNRVIHTATKSLLKSPWMNEVEYKNDVSSCDSDYESLNVIEGTRVAANTTDIGPCVSCIENVPKKSVSCASPVAKENSPRTVNRSNAQRSKRSIAGRKGLQKYHWSGTFNRDQVRRHSSSFYEKTNDAKTRCPDGINVVDDSNYNYNLNASDDEKTAKKTKLFSHDKFNLDDESSESNETVKRWPDRRSYPNLFKHDASRFNATSRRSWATRGQEEESHRYQQNETIKQEDIRANLRNEKHRNEKNQLGFGETRPSSRSSCCVDDDDDRVTVIDRYEITLSTVYVRKSNSAIDDRSTFEIFDFLLSFFKNVILFTFLPSLYMAFFIYVKQTEE